jgi:hypothetical protein
MNVHWVDKTEVVCRQLCEAIRLFFEARDRVVIHTVIASAHQILFDLGKQKGITSALKHSDGVSDQELREYLLAINYPFKFFKHADRDPNGKINIAPLERFTQDFIMDAIVMLQRIKGDIPVEAKIFWHWFVSKYPQEFEDCPDGGMIREMIKSGLAEWDFPTIREFISFATLWTASTTTPLVQIVYDRCSIRRTRAPAQPKAGGLAMLSGHHAAGTTYAAIRAPWSRSATIRS